MDSEVSSLMNSILYSSDRDGSQAGSWHANYFCYTKTLIVFPERPGRWLQSCSPFTIERPYRFAQ
jgi:hypothetical protein